MTMHLSAPPETVPSPSSPPSPEAGATLATEVWPGEGQHAGTWIGIVRRGERVLYVGDYLPSEGGARQEAERIMPTFASGLPTPTPTQRAFVLMELWRERADNLRSGAVDLERAQSPYADRSRHEASAYETAADELRRAFGLPAGAGRSRTSSEAGSAAGGVLLAGSAMAAGLLLAWFIASRSPLNLPPQEAVSVGVASATEALWKLVWVMAGMIAVLLFVLWLARWLNDENRVIRPSPPRPGPEEPAGTPADPAEDSRA